MENKFKVGDTVWFVTPESKKVYYGKIISTAKNSCHKIESGRFTWLKFDEELFEDKLTAEESIKND